MTYEKLIQEMDEKLQFPGLSNTWTMPVENRLDMELTGIKTPLGMKVQGPNVDGIQQLASQIQTVLSGLPQVRSVFSEKVAQGFYVNVDVNREEAARYGLTIADVQTAVSSGIGGQNIAENIEGRERYPINVRYQRDFRDNVEKMRGVLIGTPSGAQIPLGQVARISFTHGPAMIRDEDGALTGYIYIDLKNTDYGGFVATGKQAPSRQTRPASQLLLSMVGRVRTGTACQAAAATDSAGRLLRDLPVAVSGLSLGCRSACSHLPHHLCDEWRVAAAVAASLQLQRRRGGRLHRALWNRGRDGRRHGRLSP